MYQFIFFDFICNELCLIMYILKLHLIIDNTSISIANTLITRDNNNNVNDNIDNNINYEH